MICNLKDSDLNRKIYRIVSLEKLLDMFVSAENTLVKPNQWEDTFENFILKAKVKLKGGSVITYDIHDRIYGQCWTLQNSSDAIWRIYSTNKESLRVRTTIGNLFQSLSDTQRELGEFKCCIGKVEYLTDKELMRQANSTFREDGVYQEDIFRSLLIKRRAFSHESEVRLLFDTYSKQQAKDKIYKYPIDPHSLISQVMIDPRRSYAEYKRIKNIIRVATGFKGEIKRSLLYRIPDETIVTTVENHDYFPDIK
jgi:hypothetical protein